MAKKKLTEEQKLKWAERIFDPNRCTFSASTLVSDGIAVPIKSFDRKMFDDGTQEDDGTAEVQIITGKIIFRDGPFVKVSVDGGEIIEVELT
jgi:hypothetical protein